MEKKNKIKQDGVGRAELFVVEISMVQDWWGGKGVSTAGSSYNFSWYF